MGRSQQTGLLWACPIVAGWLTSKDCVLKWSKVNEMTAEKQSKSGEAQLTHEYWNRAEGWR